MTFSFQPASAWSCEWGEAEMVGQRAGGSRSGVFRLGRDVRDGGEKAKRAWYQGAW